MELSSALVMVCVMCSMVLVPVVLGSFVRSIFSSEEENRLSLTGERHTLP